MPEMGRPPAYETAEELQRQIDEYFTEIKAEGKKATITGIALYLGFESRQSFYDYEKKGNFSYAIKRARLRVENAYEENLHGNSGNPVVGSIFGLKNMGWSDKQEHDFTGTFTVEQITGMRFKDETPDA